MNEIKFVDTTVRDGSLSLWALGMRTGAMLAIAEQMDKCGFESMEFFGFAGYIKYVKEHKENPWTWMGEGAKKFRRTRLRYHGGLASGFEKIPRSVRLLMIERVVAHGITLTRSSDPWNDYDAAAVEIAALQQLGMEVIVNIIYTVSPRHTDEYWASRARQAAAIKPYRICFKDVAGLLTPDRVRTLVPLIQKNIGGLPLEIHAHCNNGMAPFNYLEAMKLGVDTFHTGVPPLANGSGQPSIFNVAANARALGFNPQIDLAAVRPVEKHFTSIAKLEGHPVGAPREYDAAQYLHQVPGGMISNLRHQLKLMGKEEKLDAVLDEITQVRAELGYPIMVTPFAQFVGSQAAINVIVGERYKEATDPVIQYALGQWGKEGADYMDPAVKAKILDRPRAREIEKIEHPEPSLAEVRKQYGGAHLSDEDLLLRYYAGPEFVDALKNAPARKDYVNPRQPLVRLIEELGKKKLAHVHIRKGDLSLTIQR